jgi:DNA primase
MKTYQDLKSVKYLDVTVTFVEQLLDIRFNKTGANSFSAYCPFHNDTKDSFRVYVDGKDEVRFHCFGECDVDWDVFDVIQARKKCSFNQAQQIFARHLGIDDFHTYGNDGSGSPTTEDLEDPEEPVGFSEPEKLGPDVVKVLNDAAVFYRKLLIENPERFDPVHRYLEKRGLDKEILERFNIGYAPPYKDNKYEGKALIREFFARFKRDYRTFGSFRKGGLVRLLYDDTVKAAGYYRQYVDFSEKWRPYGGYGDYFAGRITFPIYDVNGQVHGFMGRRLDNRGIRWLKQGKDGSSISTKSWLYGIDKAARAIEHYKTAILVEGIFDYFAFYNLLQDMSRPIVVSTLGTNITDETTAILQKLGVTNYVVAFDWDNAGRNGIQKAVQEIGGTIYYLGGMAEGEDPADKLKEVVNVISGFSFQHLMDAAKRIQEKSAKPVNILHITSGRPDKRVMLLESAANTAEIEALSKAQETVKAYQYDIDDFLPLLSYDNGNRRLLDEKVGRINELLQSRPKKVKSDKFFTIPVGFLTQKVNDDLGPAIILWLRLVIEQQTNKRKIRETDTTIGKWLETSRATVSRYKTILKDRGLLSTDTSGKYQVLSVRFFPREQTY